MDLKKYFSLLNKKDALPVGIVAPEELEGTANDGNLLLGMDMNQDRTPASGSQVLSEEKANELPKKAEQVTPQGESDMSKAMNALDKFANRPGGAGYASERAPATEPDYMSLLAAAQQSNAENNLVNNMLKAGQTIGSALAYSKPDYTVANSLAETAGQDVSNVLQKMKSQKDQTALNDDKLLRDPNSDVSKAFRSTLAKLGIPHSDKTTAFDAKAMGINPQNLLMQEKATQQAREMKELMLGDRARQQAYGATDRAVSNLYNSKDYKSYTNAKDAQSALDHAIATGDKTAQGTAFMSFAKFAQNDDSVVRSEDMKTLAGSFNYASPQEMISKLSAKAHGGNFSEKELQAMKAVIAKGIGLKGQRVNQMLAPIKGKIQGSGLNAEEHIDPSILQEFDTYNPKQQQTPKTSGQTPGGLVKVTRISDGATKMMTAEQAARADKSKYKVE